MKVGELKKIILDLGDDFEIELRVRTLVPDEELVKRSYPHPYDTVYTDLEFDDIGYSDKLLCLGCEVPKTDLIN